MKNILIALIIFALGSLCGYGFAFSDSYQERSDMATEISILKEKLDKCE